MATLTIEPRTRARVCEHPGRTTGLCGDCPRKLTMPASDAHQPATAAVEAPAGYVVLNEAKQLIGAFCRMPSMEALDLVTLWAALAHAHQHEAVETSPRLMLTSDKPGSGKTRVLSVLHRLTPNPVQMTDPTGPAVREAAAAGKTILLDEMDTSLTMSARSLCSVLNAGYDMDGTVGRVKGDLKIFGPAAMAGLIRRDVPMMPALKALLTRCIEIVMEPPPRDEMKPARLRRRIITPVFDQAREALAAWMESAAVDVGSSFPDLPEGIEDRTADLWEPLFSIAEVAGGDWPIRCRAACKMFAPRDTDPDAVLPPGLRLLRTIRALWGSEPMMHTGELCRRLKASGAPWEDMGTVAIARAIPGLLAEHDIRSHTFRLAGTGMREGYYRRDFTQAWQALDTQAKG